MSVEKEKDPWTDPDPQPGDFDDDIALMGPDDIEYVEADPSRQLIEIGTDDVDGWLRDRREREARQGAGTAAVSRGVDS
jgi:hypothetical protein